MNDIDRWFDRTSRRATRPVALYPSLITGRLVRYLGYRLRNPLLIATVRFAVHVAEFFILLSSLGGVAAFLVMVLRAGGLVISGGWWGLLEIMRQRLRKFAADGNRDASGAEIGRWLVLAGTLAAMVVGAAAVTLTVAPPAGAGPVARLYAFLIIVEFAIDLPVRVLHSGAYATRRVYKPVWSMFLPILVQLAILGAGFVLYPAVAIVVAIVISNALGIWITLRYTLETYRLMGLHPRFTRPWWRDLPSIPPGQGVAMALSGMSLRLDALLVLALVGFYGTNTRTFDLTAGFSSWADIDAFQFFYLILPLFRGTYESAGLFYFDLVRLHNSPPLRTLALRFFRALLWTAPMIAMFFWALAAVLSVLVLHDVPLSFLIALIPMFILRSLIGVYQIRLFAEGRSSTHLATLGLLAVLLWLVWIDPNPAGDLVQITAAMIIQLILLINLQHRDDRRDPPLPVLIPPDEWATARAREPGPTSAGALLIPESIPVQQRTAAVAEMRRTFDGAGHIAYRSPTSLLYYERTSPNRSPAHMRLPEATGGAVGRGRGLPAPGPARLRDLDALGTEFHALFPEGGAVFDAETGSGTEQMRTLPAATIAGAVPAALSAMDSGADIVESSGRWITPVFRGGVLRLLFVLPADPDRSRLRDWRRAVRRNE